MPDVSRQRADLNSFTPDRCVLTFTASDRLHALRLQPSDSVFTFQNSLKYRCYLANANYKMDRCVACVS